MSEGKINEELHNDFHVLMENGSNPNNWFAGIFYGGISLLSALFFDGFFIVAAAIVLTFAWFWTMTQFFGGYNKLSFYMRLTIGGFEAISVIVASYITERTLHDGVSWVYCYPTSIVSYLLFMTFAAVPIMVRVTQLTRFKQEG